MTIPLVRFTIRKLTMTVAGSAVALAYVGTGSTKLGCSETTVWITFHVVNDEDGRPIPGARVELIQGYGASPIPTKKTGYDGSARVSCRAGYTSYPGPFFRTYRRLYFGEALQIQADGYQPVDLLLKEYVRSPAYHDSALPSPFPIRLKCTPGTEAWHP